jgi:hypothetical protein
MNDLHHSFPSQDGDEAVFVFARPYWFVFLPTLFIFVFIFIGSVLGQLYTTTQPMGISMFTMNAIVIAIGLFQIVALLVFLVAVLDYYFDVIVVTDRRVVDINQEQLLYRKISELNLRDVEDISFERNGFFPTLMNYGSITVQTAGEARNFVINNMHFPSEISTIIADLADQAKAEKPDTQRFPETEIVGVIEGEFIRDPQDLVVRGAMLPEDVRLSIKRAPR